MGAQSVYSRQLLGIPRDEFYARQDAKTLPAFSTRELATLRAALERSRFVGGKDGVYSHRTFPCRARLAPTCLDFETWDDGAMMLRREVTDEIAFTNTFAVWDHGIDAWAKPLKKQPKSQLALSTRGPVRVYRLAQTKSIYPHAVSGSSFAELEKMSIASSLPAFTAAELKSLRASLKQWRFTGKDDVFTHEAFACEARLTPTCLYFDASMDFDAMLTRDEVVLEIVMAPDFAMFDSSTGKWKRAAKSAKTPVKSKSPTSKKRR